jgi:hypothetical protein
MSTKVITAVQFPLVVQPRGHSEFANSACYKTWDKGQTKVDLRMEKLTPPRGEKSHPHIRAERHATRSFSLFYIPSVYFPLFTTIVLFLLKSSLSFEQREWRRGPNRSQSYWVGDYPAGPGRRTVAIQGKGPWDICGLSHQVSEPQRHSRKAQHGQDGTRKAPLSPSAHSMSVLKSHGQARQAAQEPGAFLGHWKLWVAESQEGPC